MAKDKSIKRNVSSNIIWMMNNNDYLINTICTNNVKNLDILLGYVDPSGQNNKDIIHTSKYGLIGAGT